MGLEFSQPGKYWFVSTMDNLVELKQAWHKPEAWDTICTIRGHNTAKQVCLGTLDLSEDDLFHWPGKKTKEDDKRFLLIRSQNQDEVMNFYAKFTKSTLSSENHSNVWFVMNSFDFESFLHQTSNEIIIHAQEYDLCKLVCFSIELPFKPNPIFGDDQQDVALFVSKTMQGFTCQWTTKKEDAMLFWTKKLVNVQPDPVLFQCNQ